MLGAGAGGGVPQWNCNCAVCVAARSNASNVLPRTQSSIAVSADGENWCVVNCSPDIRQQILNTSCLHPRDPQTAGRRDTPIHSVVLTNGDVDHIAGLLILREKQPFRLLATPNIQHMLRENPIFDVLDPSYVVREDLPIDASVEVAPQLRMEAFLVPGKVPLFLEGSAQDGAGPPEIGIETEYTIGLKIGHSRSARHFFYIPGCAALPDDLKARVRGAALLLFDGTVWENEEMIAKGVGAKTGRRMGHMSMSGAEGSMAGFASLGVRRKVFVHINNTNPVLFDDSPERGRAEDQGWEIAFDGMEIVLQ